MKASSMRGSREKWGYVYVLSTAYMNKDGLPIVKIGRTSRTPGQRVQELSRGGPAGMTLAGAVTTRDAAALEQKAHQVFARARFIGDGGTEYFTVKPDDVLAWLRSETPRFELESARNEAWSEYVNSRPWKAQARVTMFCISGGTISALGGFFWQIGQHNLAAAIAMPFVAGGTFFYLSSVLRKVFLPNISQSLNDVRTQLEEKYHLPAGRLR